jgi:hypothetical protein
MLLVWQAIGLRATLSRNSDLGLILSGRGFNQVTTRVGGAHTAQADNNRYCQAAKIMQMVASSFGRMFWWMRRLP